MGSGPKLSASWIHLFFLCSVLSMWTSVKAWSYFYSDTTMKWEDARTWCRQHYTDMVAIQNQEEIQHLNNLLPFRPTYYWIGIRKVKDVWTWVGTNKALTTEATNWAQDEPNNGKHGAHRGGAEDCVEMYIQREQQRGKWNDERCDKLKTALCYSAACKNDSCHHGECVETINSHKCECTPGFFGEKCDQVVQCDKNEVSAPENGNVNCAHKYGDFAFNSSCQYSCKEGYQLSMERPQRCGASGSWSEQPPTCELVQCQNLIPPSRGSMKCSDPLGPSSYGSTCVFTCDEGYEFDGSPSNTLTLQCESSGSWNASQQPCVAVQCPAIQNLENGFVDCDNEADKRFSYGKTCSFSCASGYQLVGKSSITCTSAAEWSEQTPHCEAVQCPAIQNLENGFVDCDNKADKRFSYGKTCSFSCASGYKLVGKSSITCTSAAEWNEQMPHCEAVQCPVIQNLENGSVKCDSEADKRFSYGKTCSFSCASGYQLVGKSSITCTSTAEWSEKMPHCEAVQCPAIQNLENGFVDCDNKADKRFSYGKTCSFSCASGYQLVGKSSITCTSTAEWSELTPHCEAVRCLPLEAPENGRINCSNSEPIFNTQCSFICDQDYTVDGHEMLTCDHHGNWTGDKPTCEAPSPSATVIATGVTAGSVSLASGLYLAMWALKRLKQKASKFALNSPSNMQMPTEVYKSSTDSLI